MSKKLITSMAAAAAAAALAVGAYALGNQSSESASAAAQAGGPRGGQPPTGMPPNGTPPNGRWRGMGTAVSGATAQKVEDAALTKYPGRIERIEQLPDGTYVAHVITDDGELHVVVSKAFEVVGVQQRPQGPQGAPPDDDAPSGDSAKSSRS